MRFRRAKPVDADGIFEIASKRSRANLLVSGASESSLSDTGFLLYPLSASDPEKPNYRARIEGSKHFWVAEHEGAIVAYLMAYSFSEMLAFERKTGNDIDVLSYFVDQLEFCKNVIYGAQAATSPDCRLLGAMKGIVRAAINDVSDSPAMIGEIAQAPVRNKLSSRFFEHLGFRLIFHRSKDNGLRRSGVFLRTF